MIFGTRGEERRLFSAIFDSIEALWKTERPSQPSILVHSSFSSFGPKRGEARGALTELVRACESRGITLVMPAHGGETCEEMGILAETFRAARGTLRSAHPTLSFCARGPNAATFLAGHERETGLGEKSPLGSLYARGAIVVMIGTGWDTCTAMHLAEYRVAEITRAHGNTPDMVTCWHEGETWADIAYRTELFPAIGDAFVRERPDAIRGGPMPAQGRSWSAARIRDIVDFSVDTLSRLG